MKKIQLGILGASEYEKLLEEYLYHKKELLETRLFSTKKSLEHFLETHQLDMFLTDSYDNAKWAIKNNAIHQTVFLSEENITQKEESIFVIYKFQSAEKILKEVLAIAAELNMKMDVPAYGISENLQFVALTSFFDPNVVSMFDEKKIDTRDRKILWLNMSFFEMVGDENQLADEGGMSQLIYYIRQRKSSLDVKIHSLTMPWKGKDYITGVENYQDLYSLTKEDIDFLLSVLAERMQYDTVVFEVGFLNETVLYLLSRCNQIFAVKKSDLQYQKRCKSLEVLLKEQPVSYEEYNL